MARHADADREPERLAAHVDDHGADLADQPVHDGLRRLRPGIGQQHQELLAAPAAAQVVLAQAVAQHPGQLDQGAVAGLVAVAVIDRLEMIHVQHAHDEGLAAARDALHLLLDRLHQGAAVQQAGQGSRLDVSSSAAFRSRIMLW